MAILMPNWHVAINRLGRLRDHQDADLKQTSHPKSEAINAKRSGRYFDDDGPPTPETEISVAIVERSSSRQRDTETELD